MLETTHCEASTHQGRDQVDRSRTTINIWRLHKPGFLIALAVRESTVAQSYHFENLQK